VPIGLRIVSFSGLLLTARIGFDLVQFAAAGRALRFELLFLAAVIKE